MVILSPIVILNSLSGISGQQYFTATNQIHILMKAYVSAAILNVAVNAFLIPGYGYIGAAIATVGSSLISTILQYFYLTKQIRVSGLIPSSIKYGAASAIMALCILLTTRGMTAGIRTTVIQIVIGMFVYMVIMLFTKDSVCMELLLKLKSILKRRSA